MDGVYVTVLAKMLPRLQAEESLMLAQMVAVGTANVEKKERARIWKRLVKRARGDQAVERKREPLSADAKDHARRLMELGLPVTVQEKLPDGSIREVALDE